ncbi:MAG: tRNA uridine-5-carboxymethylaminomethyl(34) synthesis GTPase MnmE [Verrucomicrobiales bacterium]|nr:tRNA uridine-5-carboxymethylaminomethyl(34) synthesis GTPase MnmE [Verrucomicrobiales bacterium]
MNQDSTIAAIATPPGMGAVGLIRVSGPTATSIVGKSFSGRGVAKWVPRKQHLGRIVDEKGAVVDEVLVCYFPEPASFTGEDVVEIACHGGIVVTKKILTTLFKAGASPADPGEFSQRAFLNGKIDLTQAEAIMDLISARTDLAARAANEQLSGRLGNTLQELRQELISLIAHIEAYIDFPDEDIDPDSSEALVGRAQKIINSVNQLLATADQGKILREGIRTVIAGAPNAGKSSLLNVLLGFDRAIVNEEAGTTRDTIEEVINLEGIPIRLIDTAGIRDGGEAIEKEGIQRSLAQIENAELILLVIDSSASDVVSDSIQFPENARVLQILNKADLPRHSDWKSGNAFSISCHSPEAPELLRKHLYDFLVDEGAINTSSLTAINTRHQHCLARARSELEKGIENLKAGESPEFVAMDLRAALDAIGDVIGRTDVEEILGEIFSTFCIGK